MITRIYVTVGARRKDTNWKLSAASHGGRTIKFPMRALQAIKKCEEMIMTLKQRTRNGRFMISATNAKQNRVVIEADAQNGERTDRANPATNSNLKMNFNGL